MTATLRFDSPLMRFDERQRRALENPRAASAREMREIAVVAERVTALIEQSWFDLPEDHRHEARQMAFQFEKLKKRSRGNFTSPIAVLQMVRGAFLWWNNLGDIMTFSAALDRFTAAVSRRVLEERDGSEAAWLEAANDPVFMAALRRGDAELSAGQGVIISPEELINRTR